MDAAEFDAMARVQERHWWYRALRALLTDSLPSTDGGARILDAGCGMGAHLAALAAIGEVTAVDMSPYALRYVQSPRRTCADGAALPFHDGAFDAVVSCDVLCHAAAGDPLEHLEEAYRVLEPGGLLLLNLPAYPWMLSRHDRAVANARRFVRSEVTSMVTQAGFGVERATYWNLLLLPAAVIRRKTMRLATHSDLASLPSALEQAVGRAATALERACIRNVSLPAGLSIFVAARKG